MKAYSTRANARRAARQELGEDAVEDQDFELIEVDGQHGFRVMTDDMTNATQAELTAPNADAAKEAPPTESTPRNKSSVANPVQQVWAVADAMPEAKRKDIIAACVEQGVAFFTARTQYQKWKVASKKAEK